MAGENGGKRALSADAVACAACAHAFGFVRTTARSCVPRMRIELALCSSSGPRSIQPVPKLQFYVALSVFPSCGLLIAWQTPRKNVLVPIIFFPTFFPSRCSLVSKEDSVDFLSSKNFLQILVAQGQNFLLRFPVFEASLIVDVCRWQRISIVSSGVEG